MPFNKRSKYGARKTVASGKTFDSKKESERYGELRILEKAGRIVDLDCQPSFTLQASFKLGGRTIRAIKYKADFSYRERDKPDHLIVEDVKSAFTAKNPVYRMKIKLLLFQHQALDFREVMWCRTKGCFVSKEFK